MELQKSLQFSDVSGMYSTTRECGQALIKPQYNVDFPVAMRLIYCG
jgi:hypothetical protein